MRRSSDRELRWRVLGARMREEFLNIFGARIAFGHWRPCNKEGYALWSASQGLGEHVYYSSKNNWYTMHINTRQNKSDSPASDQVVGMEWAGPWASHDLDPPGFPTKLKGPSQSVCIAAACYCYYPGDLMSFTVQMTGYVLHAIFRLPSKRKLRGRLTWHPDLLSYNSLC